MAVSLCNQSYNHLLFFHNSTKFSSSKSLLFNKYSYTHLGNHLNCKTHVSKMPLTVAFALTQSDSSEPPKSFNPDPQILLQELAVSFYILSCFSPINVFIDFINKFLLLFGDLQDSLILPSDYFAKLPNDLRLDVRDKFSIMMFKCCKF